VKSGKLNTGSNQSKNSTGGKGKRKHLQRNKPDAFQEVLSHSHICSASSAGERTLKSTAGQPGVPGNGPGYSPPYPASTFSSCAEVTNLGTAAGSLHLVICINIEQALQKD